MRTYVSEKAGVLGRLTELAQLYKYQTRDVAQQVSEFIVDIREMERDIAEAMGSPLKNKQILEIGPGQKQPHLLYFARENDYIGIDLDLPTLRIGPKALWRMWRTNGAVRTLKTLGRRVLGIDAAFKKEMIKQLGGDKPLRATLKQMDATQLALDDDSFDCVFAISVFEHLPQPGLVTREIARVLKPGGVAYIITHLYTSDTGIHDPRLYGDRGDIPYWAHLMPDAQHLVKANCYLNEIRMAAYEEEFRALWPGCVIKHFHNKPEARKALAKLRAAGKLAEYTDEELLTDVLATIWVKPRPN